MTHTPRAYVLMTAMPPTKGHKNLIEFASALSPEVEVIVATQPGEPYEYERVGALREAFSRPFDYRRVTINHIRKTLPQEPTPEIEAQFWDMWAEFLRQFGIRPGDYIVSSETYGMKLAEITGGIFMPYDMERSIMYTKATEVRANPYGNFEDILPEFQPVIRKTITLFGAESTGKTTLSRILAKNLRAYWGFEWARPYLETVGNDIHDESMTAIWKGQLALQRQLRTLQDKPFIVQDTDLFSTIGYWNDSIWARENGKQAPVGLVEDALATKSDLYIITKSNIPFEHDQLRYGGDEREISDERWIEIAEAYKLNYVVLDSANFQVRLAEAQRLAFELFEQGANLAYQREGAEYAEAH